jgi:predicted amidohydrolase
MSGYNVGNQLTELAQPVKGGFYEKIKSLTSSFKCSITYGYPETVEQDVFNSAACVAPDGRLLANHRKQLNSPGSFEEDYFKPGDCATYFDFAGIKIALMICYEVEFPESVRIAAANGAQLVLVPTALVSQWAIVAEKLVPTRAFENGVWLVYANHAGHENGLDYFGGSKIVAPNGDVKADAGTVETLISAKIDPARVEAAQKRLPYLRDYTKLTRSS